MRAGLIVCGLLAVLYFVAHRPLVWFQYSWAFALPVRFWHVGAGRTYRVYVAR